MFILDTLLHHNIFPLQHMVQRKGAILEALFRISEGFYFGPHHLIMTALLYFEEKVHKKKLLRADAIPLLFPRLLCQILEHLGYPSKPQLEHRYICREILTLDKWTSMTAYIAQPEALTGPDHPEIPQPEEPQYAEIPIKIIAPAPAVSSIVLMPEATLSAPLTTPRILPVIPAASAPHPSESTIAMSISDFRGLCHTLQTLTATQSVLAQQMVVVRAHQDQLIATQTQHTAILRQIHQHLGILSPPKYDMPGPSKPTDPSQDTLLVEQTMPTEERTIGEIEAPIPSTKTSTAKPSSPHDPPTTI